MKISYIFIVLALSVSAEKSNLEDPVLFCDGCFAMVSEIEKDMSVRSGASQSDRSTNTEPVLLHT